MILADKITELRKKNGWSQEELAEKLDVSRQAVSKWESAQSVPDMNRVLMLSELFGVSTDFLLKDELGPETDKDAPLPEDGGKTLRKVSLSQAQDFLQSRVVSARRIALGVLLCILSPIALILLAVGQETGKLPLSEEQAVGLGLICLFLLVGAAVVLFVLSALSGKRFEFMETECFETEYGVTGFVRERREREQGELTTRLVVGIALCVLSVLPIFIAMLLPGGDFQYAAAVAVLLCFVAAGVWLIVRAAILRGAYARLLEEDDYSRENKRAMQRSRPIAGIYWSLCTAGYLAYSFITGDWQRSWIVWPVAGVLYGVIFGVTSAVWKKDR